ncbi:MAG: hypothetical protein A3F17_06785 [Gammaproteobacteria bacterium RIFCSPHIGHO2_12_FULL_41_15]|nr:MAG: hypothetical protein A3F17_06785 [Gammaproteobacteria bacterium RIFCSPHIGHO2_12_FULL_41_15]
MFKHHPTTGGTAGHIFRRVIHLCIALIPILYFSLATPFTHFFQFSPHYLLIVIIVGSILFEIWRLNRGIVLPGHRHHEKYYPASFFWGSVSLCLVLLLVPGGTLHGEAFALPIIWSSAFADPIIGELRSQHYPSYFTLLIGMLVVLLVWWFAAFWYGIAYWWGLLMAPVTVAVEWPKISYIDDNMTMLIVPLLLVVLLHGPIHAH